MSEERTNGNSLDSLVGWWRDVRSVRECKSILRANLDRDYDKDDSLRALTVVAVNALYRARHNPPNEQAQARR